MLVIIWSFVGLLVLLHLAKWILRFVSWRLDQQIKKLEIGMTSLWLRKWDHTWSEMMLTKEEVKSVIVKVERLQQLTILAGCLGYGIASIFLSPYLK